MLIVWQNSYSYMLFKVQKLYGKLLYASLVIFTDYTYLIGLNVMLSIFYNKPFKLQTFFHYTSKKSSSG